MENVHVNPLNSDVVLIANSQKNPLMMLVVNTNHMDVVPIILHQKITNSDPTVHVKNGHSDVVKTMKVEKDSKEILVVIDLLSDAVQITLTKDKNQMMIVKILVMITMKDVAHKMVSPRVDMSTITVVILLNSDVAMTKLQSKQLMENHAHVKNPNLGVVKEATNSEDLLMILVVITLNLDAALTEKQ